MTKDSAEETNIEELLENYVNQKLEEACKIYEKEIFPEEESIFCDLHEIMVEKEEDHNCIGCNLDEYSILIYSTLLLLDAYTSVKQKFFIFITTLYLLVERIDTILNIVSLHEVYRKEKFKTLNKIRKWANFIKHPKAFILAHHPFYSIEGFAQNSIFRKEAHVVVDSGFVFKYYSNDDKNKELFKKIENKEGVLVIFPDPVNLTKKFCQELKIFNKLLKNNEVYREILGRRSTFLGFWLDEEE